MNLKSHFKDLLLDTWNIILKRCNALSRGQTRHQFFLYNFIQITVVLATEVASITGARNFFKHIIDGLYGRIGPNWVVLDGLD